MILAPAVSVVMAVFNGAETLARAVGSVQRQSFSDWELVIVDDGSTDASAAILADFTSADPRIRVLKQPCNTGVCAARNQGIAAATGRAVLFLDADDWIADHAITTLFDVFDAHPDCCAVYGRYARVTPNGENVLAPFAPLLTQDAVACFAHRCPVTINSVLVRRQSISEIDGFGALEACEDWDLWARLADTGARFVGTDAVVAYYAMRQESLSGQYHRMLRDGLAVQRQAASRLKAAGGETSPQPAACYAIWVAAAAMAAGQGIDLLLDEIARLPIATLDPQTVAGLLPDAVMVGAQGGPDVAALAWTGISAALETVITRLTDSPDPALLWQRIARQASQAFAAHVGADNTPYRAPFLHMVSVDLGHIKAVVPLAHEEADTLGVIWMENGLEVGRSFLPGACATVQELANRARDLFGTARVKAPLSISERLKKRLFSRGTSKTNPAALQPWQQAIADRVIRDLPAALPCAEELTVAQAHPSRFNDASGWDTLFAMPDPYDLSNPYEDQKRERVMAMLDGESLGELFEPGCAEGHLTVLLAAKAKSVTALDISPLALSRARARLANAQNVTWEQSGLLEAISLGPFDTIICSELLYLLPSEDDVALAVASMRDMLREGGRLLSVHAFMINDQPDKTGIDSDLPFGGERIAGIIAATDGLTVEQTLRTPLYRIDVWRKGEAVSEPVQATGDIVAVPERLAPAVLWEGVAMARSQALAQIVQQHVPVLMFHRIASDGPAALAPWRISANRFDAMLALLRRHGFYSINSAQFAWYGRNGRSIPGRPVMLSFDDGTTDFATTAAPILARYGFTAEVFAVTSLVGKTASWDNQYGLAAPLMDWPTLRAMRAQGHAIGSHLATHSPVDGLSTQALFAEMLESRLVLERQLGVAVTSLAYPFGVVEERAVWLARDAGYDMAFTTAWGLAPFVGNQLALPRLEMWPEMTDSELMTAMEVV